MFLTINPQNRYGGLSLNIPTFIATVRGEKLKENNFVSKGSIDAMRSRSEKKYNKTRNRRRKEENDAKEKKIYNK